MCNEKLIKAIEKFDKENDFQLTVGNEKELQSTVAQLSERVQYLESLLMKVSQLSGALKNQTIASGSDPSVIELAEKLAAIESGDSDHRGDV